MARFLRSGSKMLYTMGVTSAYFYSISQPQKGVVGKATLDNGVLTTTGVATACADTERKKAVSFKGITNPTDEYVFDRLSTDWTNGIYFTLPKEFSGKDVATYVG